MSKYLNLFIQSDEANYQNDKNSSIIVNFNPSIKLPESQNENWYASCTLASIPYISPNIYNGNYDTFKFIYNGTTYVRKIQTGLYNIDALELKLDFYVKTSIGPDKTFFSILPETSTGTVFLKAVQTGFTLLFDDNDGSNVMKMIGYPNTTLAWTPSTIGGLFQGTTDTNVDQLQVINVHCSFVASSYQTSNSSNVLCSIHPDVEPFSRIQYKPSDPSVCQVNSKF